MKEQKERLARGYIYTPQNTFLLMAKYCSIFGKRGGRQRHICSLHLFLVRAGQSTSGLLLVFLSF
jgi:hypothetical protein